jgi:putative flippase GtrA
VTGLMNRAELRAELTTATRFVLVGLLTLGIYLGVFAVMRLVSPQLVSLTVAYGLAISFHYLANRLFTFRQPTIEPASHASTLLRYGAVVALGYLVNLLVYAIATRGLGLPEPVALVAGIAVNTGGTFLLSRFWVFSPR